MIGKKVRINMKSTSSSYFWGYVYIVMQDGTEEQKIKSNSEFNSTIDIPENAARIKFYAQANVILYEIQPSN